MEEVKEEVEDVEKTGACNLPHSLFFVCVRRRTSECNVVPFGLNNPPCVH